MTQPRSLVSTSSKAFRLVALVVALTFRYLVALSRGTADVAYADRLLGVFTWYVFRLARAKLVVEGRGAFSDDTLGGRAAIVMSNHRSAADIPALLAAVPGSLRMVMKQSLASFPVWSLAIRAAGFVPIDRANHSHALQQLERAKRIIGEKRVHLWIAPEGTRSKDGALLPFKKGGFHLAQQLGAPIVPAFVDGASDLMERPGARVRVRFGAPIETTGRDIDALVAETRAVIEQLARDEFALDLPTPTPTPSPTPAATPTPTHATQAVTVGATFSSGRATTL